MVSSIQPTWAGRTVNRTPQIARDITTTVDEWSTNLRRKCYEHSTSVNLARHQVRGGPPQLALAACDAIDVLLPAACASSTAPAAVYAHALMDEQSWTAAPAIVFPDVVLALYAADVRTSVGDR